MRFGFRSSIDLLRKGDSRLRALADESGDRKLVCYMPWPKAQSTGLLRDSLLLRDSVFLGKTRDLDGPLSTDIEGWLFIS